MLFFSLSLIDKSAALPIVLRQRMYQGASLHVISIPKADNFVNKKLQKAP
jgi:hypothetical protein